MKTIVTMTLNPAINKSSSVENVMAEGKLYCNPPRFEPGGGGMNVSGPSESWAGNPCSSILFPAGRRQTSRTSNTGRPGPSTVSH